MSPPSERPADARRRATRRAVAEATRVADVSADVRELPRQRVRPFDPLTSELRREVLPLLVLHYISHGPSYGNQLMDRISELTAGALTVNPNTMYPLLRQLEARGLVRGEWEHPERRSRRFYRITDEGSAECARLKSEVGPRLKRIGRSIQIIQRELAS